MAEDAEIAERERAISERAHDAARRFASGSVDVAAALFADIVTDVRRRVVEEGFWGKPQDGPPSQLAAWNPGDAQLQPDLPHTQEMDPFDPWGWHKEPAADPAREAASPTPPADADISR